MRSGLFFLAFWGAALPLLFGADKFAAPPGDLGPNPALDIRPLADTQLDQAAAFFDQKNYAEALPAYMNVLPALQDARRQEALFRIAECYRILRRPDEADGAYKMLVQTYPGTLFVPLAEYQRGQIAYQKKEWGAALDLFNAALQSNPDRATKEASQFFAAASQLQVADKEKDGTAGLEAFASQEPAGPYTSAAAQMLAEYQDKTADWAGAAKNWQIAYAQAADKAIRAQAAARAALAFLKLDRPADAEKLFQECRQVDPAGSYAKVADTGLLDLYFHEKRDQDVVDFFNQNRKNFLDSSRGPVLLEVARAKGRLKDWPGAIGFFDLYLAQFKDAPDVADVAYERLLARAESSPETVMEDCAAYLAAYPHSARAPSVLFLQAQRYSQNKDFAAAAPIWDRLAHDPSADLPAPEIYFEAARAHAALKEWKAAADGFALFIQKFPLHPSVLAARQEEAVALQNIPDAAAAEAAWEEVAKMVPPRSPEAQTAIEQEAVLDGRLDHHGAFMEALRRIHDDFPESHLWPLAAYTLGADAFAEKQYDEAEPLLRQARAADAKNWEVPALYRLVWIAYQKKDVARTAALVREYDALPDKQAKDVRVPAAIDYWLATSSAAAHQDAEAAFWFAKVTIEPDAGNYRVSAWWQLGEAQRRLKQWPEAVDSYETFRNLDPKSASNIPVLLALAEAQTGAGLYTQAKEHLDQVLLAEPEGKNNAKARFLTGQWYFAQKQYTEAIKSFATLSLIYKDENLTPRTLMRAAQAADLAGDKAQAQALREKLKQDYPNFTEPQP